MDFLRIAVNIDSDKPSPELVRSANEMQGGSEQNSSASPRRNPSTDGTLSRADFVFDAEQDRYTCPGGKPLVQFHRTYATPCSGITKEGTRLYRASKRDCVGCALKPKCRPNTRARKTPATSTRIARDVARALADTPAFERSRHRRKKLEMLFAHLRRILQAQPPPAARTMRRPRRVPARRHRPEPQKARNAETNVRTFIAQTGP